MAHDDTTQILPAGAPAAHASTTPALHGPDASRAFAVTTPVGLGTSEALALAGRYRLAGLLGSGGMGTVYRVRDLELDEDVALKVLHREILAAPDVLARFRQEVKLARRVTHQNVARVFDIGEHEGLKFLTMELVEGESLAARIAARGPLPVAEVLRLARGLCDGLAAAHAADVVHRDLKPENVLITPDGRPVITDFGVARSLEAGAARTLGRPIGTPAYMAPEQVEGAKDLDGRADLYALGALLYEALTGRPAWPGDSIFAVAAARLTQPPPNVRDARPEVPEPVAAVVLRCMARHREERFLTAGAVAVALAAASAVQGARETQPYLSPLGLDRPAPAPPPAEKSVAVLPFRNAGAPDDAYIADGLTEDLIDSLSMVSGLKVRSRGAVTAFAAALDAREAGRRLDVQVVVEGSVRRLGDKLRVNARLVSVADGFQLWAKRFDSRVHDMLDVNDEAAEAIAAALTADRQGPARKAPTDPEAFDIYLRARALMRNHWLTNYAEAIALLEQALARAPEDAAILSAYALARARGAFLGGAEGAHGLQLARQAAERAVERGPELGDPWVALANVRFNVGDPAGAVRALVRAVHNAPSLADAQDLLGRIFVEVDLLDEGIARLERTEWLEPGRRLTRSDLIRAHALRGDWDRVAALIPELGPEAGEWRLVQRRLSIWRGQRDLEPLELPAHVDPLVHQFGHVLNEAITSGALSAASRERFTALIEAADPHSRARRLFQQIRTELLVYVGDTEAGALAFEAAVREGLLDLAWTDRCPLLAPLRAMPRFAPLRDLVAQRAAAVVDAWQTSLALA